MIDLRLYMIQRITAMLMAPFVLVHLAVMIIAIQGGLSAAEILSRTQGSLLWTLFYGGFVVAAGIHGAIGVRVVLYEWAGLTGRRLVMAGWTIGCLLIALGLRAVWAVTWGAA